MAENASCPAPVGVVGLGTMGAGIVQRLVQSGVPTLGVARREETLAGVRETVARGARLAARRKRADKDQVEAGLDGLELSTAREGLAACALVIEAIGESYQAKVALLGALAAETPPATTLTTNTSSFSVRRLAEACGAAARLVGLHFMNPAPASQLCELVCHGAVAPAHVEQARALADALGLTVVAVEDCPGFLVNRMLMPVIAEAVRLLESRVATAADIDTAMRLGCGWPMGPLALADFIGLDVVLEELQQLDGELGERYAPPPLLLQLVRDGHLGRKSGHGLTHRETGS